MLREILLRQTKLVNCMSFFLPHNLLAGIERPNMVLLQYFYKSLLHAVTKLDAHPRKRDCPQIIQIVRKLCQVIADGIMNLEDDT